MGDRSNLAPSTTPTFVALSVLQHYYKSSLDKTEFLKTLLAAAQKIGEDQRPNLNTIPVVNSKPLDLAKLYEEVIRYGGLSQIITDDTSHKIMDALGITGHQLSSATLQQYYRRYLLWYEHLQFNKISSSSKAQARAQDETQLRYQATMTQITAARSYHLTAVAVSNKRMKYALQRAADLSVLQRLVLALDSGIVNQATWSLNQLTVLSYSGGADEAMIVLSSCPTLLDALVRQLQEALRDDQAHSWRYVKHTRVLVVLNILRNFALLRHNEQPLATHAVLVTLLVECLLLGMGNHDVSTHALEILACIAKTIGSEDREREKTSTDSTSVKTVYRRESCRHSEDSTEDEQSDLSQCSLIKRLMSIITKQYLSFCSSTCPRGRLSSPLSRLWMLKSCVCISEMAQNPQNELVFTTDTGQVLIDNLVTLLSVNTSEFMNPTSKPEEDPDALDTTTTTTTSDETSNENVWPVPWRDSKTRGDQKVHSSMVFGPKGSSRNSWPNEDALDHVLRDAALEALYHLSSYQNMQMRYWIGSSRYGLSRLSAVLLSQVGRPEAARLAAGTISNVSMNRQTFPYFLPIEQDLVLVAGADENVTDLLSNVVADVFSMHSLM